MVARKLPTELIDQVIDHLHDDKQSLLSCAAVSRSCLHTSRYHLFQTVVIRETQTDYTLDRFHIFLDVTPHIRGYIRSLKLNSRLLVDPAPAGSPFINGDVCAHKLTSVASLLPRLRELELEDVRIICHCNLDEMLPIPFGPPIPLKRLSLQSIDLASRRALRDTLGAFQSQMIESDNLRFSVPARASGNGDTAETAPDLSSQAATDDEDFPCPRCQGTVATVEGSLLVIFGQSFFHSECFRCVKCNKEVGVTTLLLLLQDGSLVCQKCSYRCRICVAPILQEAIMAGDDAYHAECFRCTTCRRRIEELIFARTGKGIYCMSCHNECLAKLKRHQQKREAKSRNMATVGPSTTHAL